MKNLQWSQQLSKKTFKSILSGNSYPDSVHKSLNKYPTSSTNIFSF